MTQTENYSLNKLEPSDRFDLSALNDNMDAIDATLYELSQRRGGATTYGSPTIQAHGIYASPAGAVTDEEE